MAKNVDNNVLDVYDVVYDIAPIAVSTEEQHAREEDERRLLMEAEIAEAELQLYVAEMNARHECVREEQNKIREHNIQIEAERMINTNV